MVILDPLSTGHVTRSMRSELLAFNLGKCNCEAMKPFQTLRSLLVYIQRTNEDIKTPVNVYIKYHARTATTLTLEKQVGLLGYGYRNIDSKTSQQSQTTPSF